MQVLRCDLSLWQTQKGAQKMADVPKSPKTQCDRPSCGQEAGTGLAPAPLCHAPPAAAAGRGSSRNDGAEGMRGQHSAC